VGVFIRLPPDAYDRLYLKAAAARVTVPEVIRRTLASSDREREGER
jgi:hypothetical protein